MMNWCARTISTNSSIGRVMISIQPGDLPRWVLLVAMLGRLGLVSAGSCAQLVYTNCGYSVDVWTRKCRAIETNAETCVLRDIF